MSSNRGGYAPQAAFNQARLQGAAEALLRNWNGMNKNARMREFGRIAKAVAAINRNSTGLTNRQLTNMGWTNPGRPINSVLGALRNKVIRQQMGQ